MKIKKKIKKYGFTFDEETAELLELIAKETDLNKTIIVQRGIEMFAKTKLLK